MTDQPSKGLDFSRLTKEDVQKAFAGLPDEKKVQAVVEAMKQSLEEAQDFEELIEKIGEWAARILTIAGKLL